MIEKPGEMFNYREPERKQSDNERTKLANIRKQAGTGFIEPPASETPTTLEDLPEFKEIESEMVKMLRNSGLGPIGSRQSFATRLAHHILERDLKRDAQKHQPEKEDLTPKPEDFGYKQTTLPL